MSTMITNERSDALAARAAGGDRGALADLFLAHQDTVLDLVADRLTGSLRIHIEDAAQDVWVEVCEWITLVDAEGFVDWLVTLADEVADRYRPAPAPSPTAPTAPSWTRFANPLRLASMRLAVRTA